MPISFSEAINKAVANPKFNYVALVASLIEDSVNKNIEYMVDNCSDEIIDAINRLGCRDIEPVNSQDRAEEIIYGGGLTGNALVNTSLTYSHKSKTCSMTMISIATMKMEGISHGLSDKEQESVKNALRYASFTLRVKPVNRSRTSQPDEGWYIDTTFKIKRIEFLSEKGSCMGKLIKAIYVELEEA